MMQFFYSLIAITAISILTAATAVANWPTQYREAMKVKSCSKLKELANQQVTNSQITDLAWVQTQLICDGDKDLEKLILLYKNPSKTWMKETSTTAAYKVALAQNRHDILSQLSIEYSRFFTSQLNKEEVLNQGLQSAQSLGDNQLIQEIQNELWKHSPRLKPNPSQDELMKVADDFKRNRAWQKSADTYQRVFDETADSNWRLKLDAIDGVRRTLKEKFRSGEDQLQVFLDASIRFGNYAFSTFKSRRSSVSLDDQRDLLLAWFQHGRDFWSYAESREEQMLVRRVVLEALELQGLSKYLQAEAYVLLSRVSKNYQEYTRGVEESDKAVMLIKKLRNAKKWQRELHDNAFWLNAFMIRLNGDLKTSLKRMKTISETAKASWAKRRALFWVARTNKQLGFEAKAQRTYRQLISQNPYHYYAIWARFDAGIKVSPLERKNYTNPSRPSEVPASAHKILSELVQAGEGKLAKNYLNQFIRWNSQKLNHMIYRHSVGDHSSVISTFFSSPAHKKNLLQKEHAGLLYPKPHNQLVKKMAERFPFVDEFYIYSIMRQESAYNPYTLSWADARGLLQLVPRVAEVEKDRAGVGFDHVDELFLPYINIPIGTAALDTRFQMNENNFIISTCSYNAGEKRVHRWWRNLYTGDIFEFLEDIPTEETRMYIRLVSRNYFNYQRLAADSPFTVNPRFFELHLKKN